MIRVNDFPNRAVTMGYRSLVATVLLLAAVLAGCGPMPENENPVQACADTGEKPWMQSGGAWSLGGRLEFYESNNSVLRTATESTAMIMKKGDLESAKKSGHLQLSKDAKRRTCCAKNAVCRPYGGQAAMGRCTGFLVAEDTLVTAGHCVDRLGCDAIRAMFGIYKEDDGDAVMPVAEQNVFACKKVLEQEFTALSDYAVIQLDRKVKNQKPLPVRETSEAMKDESVGLVGGPGGVPLKLSGAGKVRPIEPSEAFFVEGWEAVTGDSGAPVLNLMTGKVEGVYIGVNEQTGLSTVTRIGCFRATIPGYTNSATCNES